MRPLGKLYVPGLPRASSLIELIIVLPFAIYARVDLLYPLVSAFFAWSLLRRFIAPAHKPIALAFSIQTGHFVWFFSGMLLSQQITISEMHLVFLLVGLFWLLWKPGYGALFFLISYQLLSLWNNYLGLVQIPMGTDIHRSIVAHMMLRVLALVFLFSTLFQLRKFSLRRRVIEA